MKLSRGKKIGIAIGTVVVAGGIIAGGVAIVNFQNSQNAKQKIQENEFYKELTEQEKEEFNTKLETLTKSDDYNNLNKEQKDQLVDKFVESEKLQKEMESDSKKTSKEVESVIAEKQTELEQTKQQLQDLKNNPEASKEQIAEAEQKQQQVEEQIKAAEQEKTYLEIVESTKESASSNKFMNSELKIRRINGIYKKDGLLYFNADFVKEEIVGGVSIFSQVNQFCRTNIAASEDMGVEEILQHITSAYFIKVDRTCQNKNQESHKQMLDQAINSVDWLQYYIKDGYNFNVVESWENGDDKEHPEFIVEMKKDETEAELLLSYNGESYNCSILTKICPEFWAQREIEQAKSEQQSDPQMSINNFAEYQKDGKMTSFDYSAYLNSKTQNNKQQPAPAAPALFPDTDLAL